MGRDPFNQNFPKFLSKTQWIGSVQPEKFRKNWSTFWGRPLFPVQLVGNFGWMDRTHIVVRFITIILSDGLTSIRSGRISWRMNFYWDISKQWKKREICRCVFTCFEKLEEIDKNLDLLQVDLLFERRGRERSSCSDEWLFWKSIKIVLITR